MKYNVTVNGKKYEVEVEKVNEQSQINLPINKENSAPKNVLKSASNEKIQEKTINLQSEKSATQPILVEGDIHVKAPMPGTILDVKIEEGTNVKKGDVLFILEAMKMENEILAENSGKIKAVYVTKNAKVANGDLLAIIN